MKKSIFSILCLTIGISMSNAQESTFSSGDKVLNIGIGLGNVVYSGAGYSSIVPPISASFEYGVMDGIGENGSIGVGGYFGYTSAKWEMTLMGDTYGWKYNSYIVGVRGSFHYTFVDKLDTYAGLMLGYNIVKATETGTINFGASASGSGFAWSIHIGGRYFFNPHIAAMMELGYGISYLNLGIAFKL